MAFGDQRGGDARYHRLWLCSLGKLGCLGCCRLLPWSRRFQIRSGSSCRRCIDISANAIHHKRTSYKVIKYCHPVAVDTTADVVEVEVVVELFILDEVIALELVEVEVASVVEVVLAVPGKH